jgi:ribulose-phosphate 3-epimerase
MIYIAPSLLAADFSNLAQDIERVRQAGANYLHLDVMDGVFVPNISFGPPVIESIRKKTKLFFDVHLMIKHPQRYIENFIKAGADSITIHYESTSRPRDAIMKIKDHDVKAGIAISPNTPYEAVLPYLDIVDMVLVMTVEPGFGGQKMMPDMLEKVRTIRQYAIDHNIDIDIEVDGGLTPDNVHMATEAGANIIVAGSAVFNAPSAKAVINKMKETAELYPFGSGLGERLPKGKVRKR